MMIDVARKFVKVSGTATQSCGAFGPRSPTITMQHQR
jgi:hypothetical protein